MSQGFLSFEAKWAQPAGAVAKRVCGTWLDGFGLHSILEGRGGIDISGALKDKPFRYPKRLVVDSAHACARSRTMIADSAP